MSIVVKRSIEPGDIIKIATRLSYLVIPRTYNYNLMVLGRDVNVHAPYISVRSTFAGYSELKESYCIKYLFKKYEKA